MPKITVTTNDGELIETFNVSDYDNPGSRSSLPDEVMGAVEQAEHMESVPRPADNPDYVKSSKRAPRDVPDSEWRAVAESLPHGAWVEPANDDVWVVSLPEYGESDFTDLDEAVRWARAHAMPPVPPDFPVQPGNESDAESAQEPMQCGTCGRWWDDAIVTALTPVPSGRCPFESFHPDPDLADD